jgi:hypothetical protein
MLYDNSVTSGSIPGTRNFGVDNPWEGRNEVSGHAATNTGAKNGRSRMFVIVTDPTEMFKAGVASFTATEMALGIRHGAFVEGMMWRTPEGYNVRLIKGKLRRTHGRTIYKLPEFRV